MKSNTSSVSVMPGRQVFPRQASLGKAPSIQAPSIQVSSCQAGPSARQIISDVTMLASWAVLIPGMMWIGSAVGF